MTDAVVLIVLVVHLRQRGQNSPLTRSLAYYGVGAVSRISQIEYEASEYYAQRRPAFERDFPGIWVLPISDPVLRRAPYIQAASITAGRKMDFADLLIASTAIYHNLPLLTLNTDHFKHIERLRLLKVQ